MEHLDFIGESKVKKMTPYNDLIEIIEEAFIAYDNDNVEMPDKSYIMIDKHNGDFRSMPAYVDTESWEASGIKWVNVHPDNKKLDTVMGTLIYTDPQTGQPLATMDGTEITKRRTATASAIATEYLAKDNINSLGILGAGVQAYEQVRAIEKIRDFEKIFVSDIDEEAVNKFKKEFDEYNVISTNPNDLTNADVLCTITPVNSPVIDEIHNENIHINAMGADAPSKQEFDTSLVSDPKTVLIVDSESQAVHSGEISQPISGGFITEDDIDYDLGEIVNEKNTDKLKSEKTMFDSTGLAIQDIATAHLIYKKSENI